MIAGRGAFIESFPLFGYDLADYDSLFPEKIDLLLKLNAAERITWHGSLRPALEDAEIAPRPQQEQLPIWIGVGGSPQSVAAAAELGLPIMVGIIGGVTAQFAPLMEYYRKAGLQKGWPLREEWTGSRGPATPRARWSMPSCAGHGWSKRSTISVTTKWREAHVRRGLGQQPGGHRGILRECAASPGQR